MGVFVGGPLTATPQFCALLSVVFNVAPLRTARTRSAVGLVNAAETMFHAITEEVQVENFRFSQRTFEP